MEQSSRRNLHFLHLKAAGHVRDLPKAPAPVQDAKVYDNAIDRELRLLARVDGLTTEIDALAGRLTTHLGLLKTVRLAFLLHPLCVWVCVTRTFLNQGSKFQPIAVYVFMFNHL